MPPESQGKGPSAHMCPIAAMSSRFGWLVGTQDEEREIVFGFQDIAEETAQTFVAE